MTEKHPPITDELIAKLDARAEREKAIRNATGSLTLAELQRVTPEQIRALPELIAIAKYLRDVGWNAGVSDDAEEALKKAGVK